MGVCVCLCVCVCVYTQVLHCITMREIKRHSFIILGVLLTKHVDFLPHEEHIYVYNMYIYF